MAIAKKQDRADVSVGTLQTPLTRADDGPKLPAVLVAGELTEPSIGSLGKAERAYSAVEPFKG